MDQADNGLNAHNTAQSQVAPNTRRTVARDLSESYKSFASKPFSHRAAISGTVGAAWNLVTSDKKDQSVISTILDAGIAGGTAIGIESATSYIVRNHSSQISEFFSNAKNVSTGDLAQVTNEIDVDKMVAKAKGRAGKVGWAVAGIGAFIGATSLIGVSHKLERNREVARMQNDAEYALYKKEKEEGKTMSQMFGYNKHQPMGQLVMDMWDDRMGHHKMGNSKFQ
jgi:hypothetical protein